MRKYFVNTYFIGLIFVNSFGVELPPIREAEWSDPNEIRVAKEKTEYEKSYNAMNPNDIIQPWVFAFSKRGDSIKITLRSVSKKRADELFLDYYRYATKQYLPAIGRSQFMAKYYTLEADTLKLNSQERILAKEFNHQGIVHDAPAIGSRGIYFKKNYYLNMFGPHVSEELKKIIELKEWEDLHSEDGGCGPANTFEQMSDRIPAWEEFIEKYPESNYLPIARKYYYGYLNSFFCSTGDNNPFKIGTQDKDDLLPLFKTFEKNNRQRKSGKIAKIFLEVQKKHHYKKISNLPDILDIGPVNFASDF